MSNHPPHRRNPTLSDLLESRQEQLAAYRTARREAVLRRPSSYDALTRELLSTTDPYAVLTTPQSAQLLHIATQSLTSAPDDALELFYLIATLQCEEATSLISPSYIFLVFLLLDPNKVGNASRVLSSVAVFATQREILKSLGAAEYALNAAIKFNKPIELLPLITTFVVDDSTFAAQVAASTLPQKAIESLFRTNSTTDISNILTFLSSICCEKIVAKNIWGVPGFADYLTAIISTGSSSSVVGPALGIIGNFLSVCELNERNLFLKSDLIEGVLRLVQCGGKLVKDAVWVLGNIIAVAPVNIVKTIVECGTIPLLMRLVDEEKRNKKLIWELFVALTNILVKGEGNTYPFVESCIRLGFVEIAMDFVSECVQLTELIADAFYFLADHHIGFSKKLVEINALPLLQQTNNSRVQMLLEKLRYV